MLSLVSTSDVLEQFQDNVNYSKLLFMIHQVQVAGSWNDWKPEDLIKEEDCFILK